MLGRFEIILGTITQTTDEYDSIYQSAVRYRNQVVNIKGQLDDESYGDVKTALTAITEKQKEEIDDVKELKEALEDIVKCYEKTENKLSGNSSIWKTLLGIGIDSTKDTVSDLFGKFLESTGTFLVQL